MVGIVCCVSVTLPDYHKIQIGIYQNKLKTIKPSRKYRRRGHQILPEHHCKVDLSESRFTREIIQSVQSKDKKKEGLEEPRKSYRYLFRQTVAVPIE